MVFLGASLAVPAWWILAPDWKRPLLRIAPAGLVGLAIIQLALEDFYWQLVPAYLVLAVVVVLSVVPRLEVRGFARWAGKAGLVLLMLAAIAPWTMFLPVPALPRPEGPYAVGTETFRWIDTQRDEPSTEDPSDHRNVIVQAWYPAADNSKGRHSVYIDGLGHLPPSISLLPSFLMAHFGHIDTHGIVDAPVSNTQAEWPVIIFMPGYGAPRAFYTGLVSNLASKGYIVLALDHPYESAVTKLADGRIATTVEHFDKNDPDRTRFMEGRLNLRIGDVRFAIDQMARPGAFGPRLSGRLDASHIAAAGHSLGGATAAAAMDRDPRIKAAVNVDGTLYGGLSGDVSPRPFLLVESDHSETPHSDRYETGNAKFFQQFRGGDYRFELTHANHFSFTDALLFLSPPARFAASFLIGGGRGAVDTQRTTADILAAFLAGPLGGDPQDASSVAGQHPGIVNRPLQGDAFPSTQPDSLPNSSTSTTPQR